MVSKQDALLALYRCINGPVKAGHMWVTYSKKQSDALAACQAENRKLREALNNAGEIFRKYSVLHASKEVTPENSAKALRNLEYSKMCHEALSTPSDTTALTEYRNGVIDSVIEKLLSIGALGDGEYIEQLRAMKEKP